MIRRLWHSGIGVLPKWSRSPDSPEPLAWNTLEQPVPPFGINPGILHPMMPEDIWEFLVFGGHCSL